MREAAISIRAVAEFERRAVRWLWPGRIPLGKLTILSGDPSLGKSCLTLDLAARVSAGAQWPDEELTADSGKLKRTAGRVLLLAAEDDVCDTIRPRLEAAGADLSRIHVVEGLRDQDGNRGFVALHRDCDVIADLLRDRNDWRLIVIDPISAYFDGMDPNSNADVRTVLGRLADLAEQTGAAVVLVSHHPKGGYSGPAIHKTIGSLAFAAVARVVWNVLRDPTDPDRRLLVPVKMNLGPPPTALAFQVTTQTDDPSSPRNPTHQQGSLSPLQTQTDNLLSRPTRARHNRSTQADDVSSPSPLTSDLCPLTSDSTPAGTPTPSSSPPTTPPRTPSPRPTSTTASTTPATGSGPNSSTAAAPPPSSSASPVRPASASAPSGAPNAPSASPRSRTQ